MTARSEITWAAGAIDGVGAPVQLWWVFNPRDPLAVRLRIESGTGLVEWEFGRALLEAAMLGPAGEGDIRLGADHRRGLLCIELRPGTGYACLITASATAEAFLCCAEQLCPGHVTDRQVDRALAAWLAGIGQKGASS